MSDYHINVFYSEEDGGYIASIPDLESCSAFGLTPEEALAEARKAEEAWLQAAMASDRRRSRLGEARPKPNAGGAAWRVRQEEQERIASKERLLRRTEEDLQQGDLGKARDRLHTLVHGHPNDLALRTRLALIYDRLQLPAMAGRYWYLEERRTDHMEAAIDAFRRSCGGDPALMLAALKFRGDLHEISGHARERIETLQQAATDKYGPPPDGRAPLRHGTLYLARDRSPRLVRIGSRHVYPWVVVAAFLNVVFVTAGLVSIGWWVYQALSA